MGAPAKPRLDLVTSRWIQKCWRAAVSSTGRTIGGIGRDSSFGMSYESLRLAFNDEEHALSIERANKVTLALLETNAIDLKTFAELCRVIRRADASKSTLALEPLLLASNPIPGFIADVHERHPRWAPDTLEELELLLERSIVSSAVMEGSRLREALPGLPVHLGLNVIAIQEP
jgi:hypothetical protein